MALFSKKPAQDLPRRRQQQQQAPRPTGEDLGQRYAFRRNRTLTGSASSQVRAGASESKADLKSPRVQAHELTRKRRHLGATLGLVVLAAVGLFGLVSQFTADAVVKVASDSSIQPDPIYHETIEKYFAKQPIERFRFLLNEDHLARFIQSAAPEAEVVTADGSAGFGKSVFRIKMRHPIAGWSIDGKQRYVDASGVAFSRNYFSAPDVQIIDKSGIQVAAGHAVASNRFLGYVGQVVGLASTQGYTVNQVIIPEMTTRQIKLHLEGVEYPVKMSVDRPAGEQVEDMARALKWMKRHDVAPEYVDVRVSGRAFYR